MNRRGRIALFECLEGRQLFAMIPVLNNGDSGADTLRAAVANAQNGDTIDLTGRTGTITLLTEITLDKELTINGPGADELSISGGGTTSHFLITDNVTINDLTLTEGSNPSGGSIEVRPTGVGNLNRVVLTENESGGGGAIFTNGINAQLHLTDCTITNNTATGTGAGIQSYGTTTITRCTISNNTLTREAEIYDEFGEQFASPANARGAGLAIWQGDVTVTNSTITGNTAIGLPYTGTTSTAVGAGVFFINSGNLTMLNCTIADNTSTADDPDGGGVYIENGGTHTFTNCLIADNTGGDNPDFGFSGGTIASGGNNLIGQMTSNNVFTDGVSGDLVGTSQDPIDAKLNVLGDNGGLTQTMSLQSASPAIDAGNDNGAPTTDQRGQARLGTTDIGAYEFSSTNTPPAFTSSAITTATSESLYTYNITATDEDDDALDIVVASKPAWLSLTDNGNGTATLSGTPTNADAGANSVVIEVDDGTDSVPQSFSITVTPVNHAPAFSSSAVTAASTEAVYTYNITTTDSDNDTRTVSVISKPNWLTFSTGAQGTATLTGTPAYENAGANAVVLRVSDGTTHVDQAFSIDVSVPRFQVENGLLVVNGGADADDIRVWLRNGDTYRVVRNGVTKNYSASGVTSVEVYGNDGNDTLVLNLGSTGGYAMGGNGDDSIAGGDGADTITGGGGKDSLDGVGGNDRLNGSGGNDNLIGGTGDDRLFGSDGNDTLDGGAGRDALQGEAGNDSFLSRDSAIDTLAGGGGTNSAKMDTLLDIKTDITTLLA